MDFARRRIREEHLAARIARRTARALEALCDELPAFARHDDFLRPRRARPGLHTLGPPAPQIRHRLLPVLRVARHVPPFDSAELILVAGELHRLVHLLIEHIPVARAVLHVVRRRGEESADRLRLKLPHHRRKLMPAAKCHEAPARRIHAAERIRPVPCRREGRDAPAAAAGHAAVVAIRREVQAVFLRHEWQQFLNKEAHVVAVHSVVFKVAVAPPHCPLHRRRHLAGPHEDADHHRHFLRRDHRLHHRLLARIVAVGLHIHARRFRRIVLRRDEDRHLTHGAGENLARRESELLRGARQNVLRLDRRRLIFWRILRSLRLRDAAARERLDEPLQMLVVR